MRESEFREMDKAWGALAVLGANVVMLLVAGTSTLVVQRWVARRDRLTGRSTL